MTARLPFITHQSIRQRVNNFDLTTGRYGCVKYGRVHQFS
jgi:hypothetical protein